MTLQRDLRCCADAVRRFIARRLNAIVPSREFPPLKGVTRHGLGDTRRPGEKYQHEEQLWPRAKRRGDASRAAGPMDESEIYSHALGHFVVYRHQQTGASILPRRG